MSTRQIVFGYGEVDGIITPLIPFNCVYDIDFGLIRFMYENGYTSNMDLLDPSFFDLFKYDTRKVIDKLYSRVEENPLKLFLNNKLNADEFYNDFMSNYYEKIIRSSVHTGIYEICTTFRSEKTIKGSIIYTNDAEYYMLKNDPNLENIELVDFDYLKKNGLEEYNVFFFKSLADMYIGILANKVKSSSVYILDYRYNFDEAGAYLKETVYKEILQLNRNIINIINVYDRNRLRSEE